MKTRIEHDSLGKLEIPADALYGIHSLRGKINFPSSREIFYPEMIIAFLEVKLASLNVNEKIGILDSHKTEAIRKAIFFFLDKIEKEGSIDSIIVDPYQGGAGTSLNMNINEIIANKALQLINKKPGEYIFIHPIDDVNKSQSTNDTFPTAFKIAALRIIKILEGKLAELQRSLQEKENEFSNIWKLGRTQFQDAVPMKLGEEFGAYAQSIARDRWRIYNAQERIRSVNLGGSAIGNSVSVDNKFVLNIVSELRTITKLPLSKGEDLIDSTQNLDQVAEVSGLIKTISVTLLKMCNDLRLMSSGPNGGLSEINLPEMQAGSSIMPGKVNPVILEHIIQISELVKANDIAITNLCGAGTLELNPFLPMISHLFLKSTSMLTSAIDNLTNNCIKGITANEDNCSKHLFASTAISTFFIDEYGYDRIAEVVKKSVKEKIPFIQCLKEELHIDDKEIKLKIIRTQSLR